MATFRFTYPYSLVTNDKGKTEKIVKLAERKPEMINENKLIACMKNWELKPSMRYTINANLGTLGTNTISIIEPNGETLKLVLPSI